MPDRFQPLQISHPPSRYKTFYGPTTMPVREDFANVGNRFLDATVASSSSSQSMLGLAPTLPWIRSKQAGRQIQNSIEQIRNLYRANPKQHLIKSKISVEQIQNFSWTNTKTPPKKSKVKKKSVPPLAGEIPEWQKRVFPPAGCLLVCVLPLSND